MPPYVAIPAQYSAESKSKRVPLRKKYKIIKKVKEHHKKQAKEAKQLAGKGKKNPIEKDPGIPGAWPFREQELAALEARRQRTLEEIEKKKVEKKERVRPGDIFRHREWGMGAGGWGYPNLHQCRRAAS